MFNSYQVLS